MQRRTPYREPASQNIMATILQSLPEQSGLTKIEYEGPRIALYSKNPGYLMKNAQIVSNMVNSVKKRIVIRTDESIRRSQEEVLDILDSTIRNEIGTTEVFFDAALGELVIYATRPFLRSTQNEDPANVDLVEKTGWKTIIRKAPSSLTAIRRVNKVLSNTVDERIRFYKQVGERIFRSKLDEIAEASIITLGGFAEQGRSCMLLSTHESNILLDCGISFGAKETINSLPRFDITGLGMNDIDAIVLSHAHLDHTGFLPALFKFGYKGPVYCSEPTLPLMILLHDKHISNFGDSWPYSNKDVNDLIAHSIPLTFGSVTDVSPDIKLVLSNSGHILGSSLVHLHIGNGDHNLVYTGDLKFGKSILLENAQWNFPRVETLIIEGTYGGKEDIFPPREDANFRLIDSINKTISENGKILLPVPCVGLAQELLLTINMHMNENKINKTTVFVDKIISDAASIYEAYPEYLSKEIRQRMMESDSNLFLKDESSVLQSDVLEDGPAIILSSPSMLCGGASLEHLKQISEDSKNKVILTSPLVVNTPGEELLNGKREILVNNQRISINCQVEKIEGFENHSDYNQLLAYINRLRPKLRRVLVNHGDKAKVQNLATSINKLFKIQTQHPLGLEAVKLL